MRIVKLMLAIALVFLMTQKASAQDVMERQAAAFGADELEESLTADAHALMEEYDPLEQADLMDGTFSIFKEAVSGSGGAVKTALRTMVHILLVVIVCQISDSVLEERGKHIVSVAGTVGIVVYCASGIHAMIGLGRETMNEIMDFSNILLPVMVSAATTSGALTGAGAVYTLSTLFSNLLVRFSNLVLVPAAYAYLALAMTDSVLQQERLKHMRELLGWAIEKGLKIVVYVFTGFLSVTGILSGAADEAALKAAKMTISGVVPVVGGIISNAASSVLSSAAVLKNAVGTFGMLSILAVFAAPFLKMGISYLMFKVSTAISGVFESGHSGLLEAIAGIMGYMLAMTASCALISLLSCCFLIKSVHV